MKYVKRLLSIVFLFTLLVLLPVSQLSAAVKPRSIKITGPTTVKVGKEIDLDAKISPANAKVSDKKIVWTSSNSKVAKVMDKYGDDTEIKGIKAGKATITVKIMGTSIKKSYNITVKANTVKPQKIAISGSKTVKVGQEIDLKAKVSPSNAIFDEDDIRWTSSNSKVAKVMDTYGDDTEIRGMKAGTATITAKIGSVKTTYKVTVKAATVKPKTITISGSKTVEVGEEIDLKAKVLPTNAVFDEDDIKWTSSKSSVARVMDTYGDDTEIKGVKAGEATITARIMNTNVKATYKVTVQDTSKPAVDDSTIKTSMEKEIANVQKQAEQLNKDIEAVVLGNSYMERRKQYYNFDHQLDRIDDQLDTLEDRVESYWERGNIDYDTAYYLEQKLDAAEEYLDTVEDALEWKFEFEFDD